MSQFAAEKLDKTILDPVFENVEPVRRDINIIRALMTAIDEDRFVRLRKVNPVASIDLSDHSVIENEAASYFVDLAGPHKRQSSSLVVVSALWSSFPRMTNSDLVLNNPGSFLHYFSPEERAGLQSSEEIFKAYDKIHSPGSTVTGSLVGWSNPDIHTASGMQELAERIARVKDDL